MAQTADISRGNHVLMQGTIGKTRSCKLVTMGVFTLQYRFMIQACPAMENPLVTTFHETRWRVKGTTTVVVVVVVVVVVAAILMIWAQAKGGDEGIAARVEA